MTGCLLDDGDVEAQVGYLCIRHFSRLRSSLLELPAVAAWLHVNLAAGGSGMSEKVTGSSEDPIPLRLDVLDFIGPNSRVFVQPDGTQLPAFMVWNDGHLTGVYGTWKEAEHAWVEEMRLGGVVAEVIRVLTARSSLEASRESTVDPEQVAAARERWQIRPVQRGGTDQSGADAFVAVLRYWCSRVSEEGRFRWSEWWDRNELSGLVQWLAGHLSWIAEQGWVDEFAGEIGALHHDSHGTAPWREERTRLNDPCASCGVRAVVAHIAEGWRRCEINAGGCGKREKLSEYELRVLLPESRRAG